MYENNKIISVPISDKLSGAPKILSKQNATVSYNQTKQNFRCDFSLLHTPITDAIIAKHFNITFAV